MKKLMLCLLSVGLLAGSVKAACVLGKFCADDTGVSVAGNLINGRGVVPPSATKATILATQPDAVGQMILCSDCAFAQTICISTSALSSPATNQFVVLVATGSACH